jgi:hypothetical protein
LKTVPSNGMSPSLVRDSSVEVVNDGTHTTIAGSNERTRHRWPSAVAMTPPNSEAATLSAWPSSAVAPAPRVGRANVVGPVSCTWAATAGPHRPAETEAAPDRDVGAHPQFRLAAGEVERLGRGVVGIGAIGPSGTPSATKPTLA